MSAPRYLPAFYVAKFSPPSEVRVEVADLDPDGAPGEVIARGRHDADAGPMSWEFFGDDGLHEPVFAWRVREPGAFDVFDERGEAIGYFRADHLSAPYLDATGTATSVGVEFTDGTYPVMSVESRSPAGWRKVTVPDRRLAWRLAAAVATELDTRSS